MLWIVNRYIIFEFLFPFLFALVILGCLMITGFVLFNLMEQSVAYQIPIQIALRIFLLRLPEMLFYTLPMASLLGSILAFSRLSSDGELLSLRMMGLSLFQILLPLIFIGLFIGGLTFAVGELLLPSSSFAARQWMHFAQTHQSKITREKSDLFFKYMDKNQLKYILYAQKARPAYLEKVVMQIYQKDVLSAILEAPIVHRTKNDWTFLKGKFIQWTKTGESYVAHFEKLNYSFSESLDQLLNNNKQAIEMNIQELKAFIKVLKSSGQNYLPLEVRLHQKLALPTTSLLFILLGATLGAHTLRSKMHGFGITLLVVFIYYFFFSVGTAMGDSGLLPTWLAAWVANLLLTILASFFIFYRNYKG